MIDILLALTMSSLKINLSRVTSGSIMSMIEIGQDKNALKHDLDEHFFGGRVWMDNEIYYAENILNVLFVPIQNPLKVPFFRQENT